MPSYLADIDGEELIAFDATSDAGAIRIAHHRVGPNARVFRETADPAPFGGLLPINEAAKQPLQGRRSVTFESLW